MSKVLNRLFVAGTLGFVVLAFVLMPSCAKDKPCRATITVVDANGSPLSGVEVKLEPSGSCTTCQTITPIVSASDASGKASFETQLPAILDIYLNGNPTGKVARFEEGKTDEVTVQ